MSVYVVWGTMDLKRWEMWSDGRTWYALRMRTLDPPHLAKLGRTLIQAPSPGDRMEQIEQWEQEHPLTPDK